MCAVFILLCKLVNWIVMFQKSASCHYDLHVLGDLCVLGGQCGLPRCSVTSADDTICCCSCCKYHTFQISDNLLLIVWHTPNVSSPPARWKKEWTCKGLVQNQSTEAFRFLVVYSELYRIPSPSASPPHCSGMLGSFFQLFFVIFYFWPCHLHYAEILRTQVWWANMVNLKKNKSFRSFRKSVIQEFQTQVWVTANDIWAWKRPPVLQEIPFTGTVWSEYVKLDVFTFFFSLLLLLVLCYFSGIHYVWWDLCICDHFLIQP